MPSFEQSWVFLQDLEGWGDPHEIPGDPGGRTAYGIAENFHPDMWEHGPPNEDQARSFYRTRYWNPLLLYRVDNSVVAAEILEFAVHASTPQRGKPNVSVKAAQRAANDVRAQNDYDFPAPSIAEDGIMGPETLRALNQMGVGTVRVLAWESRFNLHQLNYYRTRRRQLVDDFLLGWTRRVLP